MNSQSSLTPNFYALLIGIDRYLPNQLSDGASYKSLHGCARDISHVEAFVKNTLKVPEAQIFKLVASHANGSTQPSEQLPTYENMVTKFQELTAIAQPGDQVYIHYSGHGGRPVTAYPELKGKYAIDESLVPMDIGNPQARYLRDLELAKLLRSMVDKGLVVTLVLDSCHSGGATRGCVENAGVRGLSKNIVDTTPRPTKSLVASTEELIQNWQSLATKEEEKTRSLTATSGWLPEPKGYILLAACRDNELAHERPFNGKENNGVLTYWLLDSLKTLGTGITYKVLHDRILAKIYGESKQQTPMLQGEGDRLVFNGQSMSFQYAVTVLKVDLVKNRVLLQAGAAQGVGEGAELVIYELGTTDFTQTDKRVALAKIIEVDAEESWAEITENMRQEKPARTLRLYPTPVAAPTQASIEDGAPALLLSPGVKLIRKVRLLPPEENRQPKGIDSKKALAAVKATKAMVEGNRRLEFLSEDASNEAVAYYVSINEKGEYEILDANGTTINLRPSLKVEPDAAFSVVRRLVHLSQYDAILQLDNNSPTSNLKGKLKVELCSDAENWAELKPLNAPGNVPALKIGECGYLRIRNESNQDLNITVLVLQPDWSIDQLHPQAPSAFELLEHGKEKLIRLCASLPEDYTEGADIIKVFATVGATNFSWLKLPALDQPPMRMQTTRASNPLEELFASVKSENPTRNLTAVTLSNDRWATAEIKIVVKRM
ncbi:peptidase C14 [Cyanosarcina cf. burmensis CCALA 770]|nr:peptidase C14 [Cyanosarcina cf. burmensis CCALA 770]